MIDRHDNKKRNIETRISQGSPVSPILFLIYISRVFIKISEISPLATSLLFVNKLGFIASNSSVKEIIKVLEKVAKEVIKWDRQNVVTYDILKTEVVFLSKSCWQRLSKQSQKAKIKVGNKNIAFNKKTTRWLGVRLDSQLKFISHINDRIQKA